MQIDKEDENDTSEIFSEDLPFREDLQNSFLMHYLSFKNNWSKEGTEETKMLIERIATRKSSNAF